jgi:hypothetical protein
MVVSPSERAQPRDDVENVLRSFTEWMSKEGKAPSRREEKKSGSAATFADHSDLSRSPPRDPVIPVRPSGDTLMGSKSRSVIIRPLFRTFVYGCIVLAIAGVSWKAYQNVGTRTLLFSAANSSLDDLSAIIPFTSTQSNQPAKIMPEPNDNASGHVAAMPVADKAVSELQQRIETLSSDISAARASIEQLTHKQELMAQEIAQLKASEQTILQKIGSLSQVPAGPAAAQKKPTKPGQRPPPPLSLPAPQSPSAR